jgi:uncharacterized protein (TIGR02246 family)
MKTAFVGMLSALLLLVPACAPKVNDPGDVQAITQSVGNFVKYMNEGNAEAIAGLWTDKAIYADNHFPVAVGKDAIRSMEEAVFSQFKLEIGIPVEEVRVIGDLAVARGSWTAKLTPKTEGLAAISDGGSWILVCARQSDGSWKWDWCLPNSNLPMAGSTTSGEDEKALIQLELDWAAAGVKKDTAVVEKFLADDFVSNWEGRIMNKKQVLAEMKTNPAKIESAVGSDMRVFVFGDIALVHGLYSEKSTTAGKDTSQKWRWTEVYAKRDGRWQCVTQYGTKEP